MLSPTQTLRELERKGELYFASGVPHFWIANPDRRTLEGRVLGDGRYVAEAVFQVDAAALSPEASPLSSRRPSSAGVMENPGRSPCI